MKNSASEGGLMAALRTAAINSLGGRRDFALRLWNGMVIDAQDGSPRFTVVFKRQSVLDRLVRSSFSTLALAEAYINDELDIEGDLEAAISVAERWKNDGHDFLAFCKSSARREPRDRSPRANKDKSALSPASLCGKPHSIERDRQAIAHHYNVSNEFYSLWLDPRMMYSCAYFTSEHDDLETAQLNKLDYLCRKLRLAPRERLLDIGCGWGALVMYAAAHYGVHALGITLSEPQAEFANEQIRKAKLGDRCQVLVQDYREMSKHCRFDKLASIGMVEHVGQESLPTYFNQAMRLLLPGGLFLNSGIALSPHWSWEEGPTFVGRYVFPDAELVPLSSTLHYVEEAGFEICDVESLREHYARTLRLWVERLEACHVPARSLVGESTYRVWRLYMAGSAHGFSDGRLNLYHTLMAKPNEGKNGLPLTRRDWYCASHDR